MLRHSTQHAYRYPHAVAWQGGSSAHSTQQGAPQHALALAARQGARQAKQQGTAHSYARAQRARAQQAVHAAHVAPRTVPAWVLRMGRMPTL